jgi:hypothetical protein
MQKYNIMFLSYCQRFQTHCYEENLGEPGIEPRISSTVARNSDY